MKRTLACCTMIGALTLGCVAVWAINPCTTGCDAWNCSPGSVNNPGTLSKTSETICVGGSVTTPTVSGTTFTDASKSRTCTNADCTTYEDTRPYSYTTVVRWEPPIPSSFPDCGAPSFTAWVKGVSNDSDCPGETPEAYVGTFTVNVLELTIISPKNDELDPFANDFVFDKTPDPNGKCDVPAQGSSCVASEDPNLVWSLTEIQWWTTLSSNPNPPKGPTVTFTYRTLPVSNAQFGRKTLTLNHPSGCAQATEPVDIFFDGADDAKNHPGVGSGYSPNWYYYWNLTSAHWNPQPYYNPSMVSSGVIGETRYVAGAWRSYIGDLANDDGLIGDGPDRGLPFVGIDLFAFASRHEGRHITVFTFFWPNGWPTYPNSVDTDADVLWDNNESGLSKHPANGGPFVVGMRDTDGDGYEDGLDYVYWTQSRWSRGLANSEDWSSYGRQWDMP